MLTFAGYNKTRGREQFLIVPFCCFLVCMVRFSYKMYDAPYKIAADLLFL